MWIRSQDRYRLVNVNMVYVNAITPTEIEAVIADTFDDIGFPMGVYKTKERALEVLEEIQQAIISQNYVEFEISGTRVDNISRIVIYEMPQD